MRGALSFSGAALPVRMSILERHINIKWPLFLYDVVILLLVDMLLLVFSGESLPGMGTYYQILISFCSVFAARFVGKIYSQIWRYGGIQCYTRLLVTDALAF